MPRLITPSLRFRGSRPAPPDPGPVPAGRPGRLDDYQWPAPPPGTDPIGSLRQSGHATVQGRLHAAETRSGKAAGNTVLACEVGDSTGQLTAFFYGRTQITGVEPGIRIRLHGTVGIGADGHPAMINPAYELLSLTLAAGIPRSPDRQAEWLSSRHGPVGRLAVAER